MLKQVQKFSLDRMVYVWLFLFLCQSVNSQETYTKYLDSARQQPPSNLEKVSYYFQEAERATQKSSKAYFEVLSTKCEYYNNLVMADSVEVYANQLIEQDKFPNYVGKGHLEKGLIFIKLNDIDSSQYYLKQALPIFEQLDDKKHIAVTLKNLGNFAFNTGNNSEAINLYKKAASITTSLGDTLATAFTQNNMVRAYQALNEIDSAAYYNSKIIEVVKNGHQQTELGFMAYLNEADLNSELNNFEEAYQALSTAQEIADNLGNEMMLGAVFQMRTAILTSEGKYTEAVTSGELALEIFEKYQLQSYIVTTLPLLYEAAAKAEDYKTAYTYLNQFQTIQDATRSETFDKDLADLRFQYETAEKELKIAEQHAEITKKKNQQQTLVMAIVALALLILITLLWFRQRQKVQKQQISLLENEKENVALRSLMAGEEQERSRMAKELHDGLGGLLAAAKMHATHGKNPEKVVELLDNASIETRRMSHNLLPEVLLRKGLDQALSDYVKSINDSQLLQANYQSINLQDNLPQSLQLSVYRIVQELMNNIIKHSGATEAMVQLQQLPHKLMITVEDNGKGFGKEQTQKGIGLENIASRLSLLKGRLDIDSKENKGTSVYIELELEK